MLIIELNEFNRDFLEKGANTLNLKNLSYVLKLDSSTTESVEKREHHGLDPWVQWVSIHTGKKLENHGIIRNSDVEKLKFKQFWEILGEKGISTGIWGAMNAKKMIQKGVIFFFRIHGIILNCLIPIVLLILSSSQDTIQKTIQKYQKPKFFLGLQNYYTF